MTLRSASDNPRIMMSLCLILGALCLSVPASSRMPAPDDNGGSVVGVLDSIITAAPDAAVVDSVSIADSLARADAALRYTSLSEYDFKIVAEELGVEIAAIKAVVYIEAGSSLKGFYAPGVPVVNFDPTVYARYKNKVAAKGCKDAVVPEGLSGYGLSEWRQLVKARKTNCEAANLGSFWGMFQIGGFNYKRCGCESVDEFVDLMSDSEFEQLQLFAAFVKNAGMLDDLKNKNWAAFARKYNGPSYKRRGYHTKMATAYKKYKALEKAEETSAGGPGEKN